MSIWGNPVFPQMERFLYGSNEPSVSCLWFNTGGAEVPADPDVAHGMLLYRDSNDVLHPLYPMTTIAAIYGLKEKLEALAKADIDASDKLNNKIKAVTAELPADGWNENTITVNAEGVTQTNTVIVSCAADSYEAYTESAVRCIGQGNGSLRFVCTFPPEDSVTVNIVILNEVSA